MKVFISWSGKRSNQAASVLKRWLSDVIQAVEPWMSEEDIAKGSIWNSELDRALRESRVGIVCLTTENILSPWINFEAGALSKSFDESHVIPVLFGLAKSEVRPPLSQFQLVSLDEKDMKRMVDTINHAGEHVLVSPEVLDRAFAKNWNDLAREVQAIEGMESVEQESASMQTPEDFAPVLSEILELLRAQNRTLREEHSSKSALDTQPIEGEVVYRGGDQVRHETHGTGRVSSIYFDDVVGNWYAEVEFDNNERRRFNLGRAPNVLKLVHEDEQESLDEAPF